jgi:hypothetical protein
VVILGKASSSSRAEFGSIPTAPGPKNADLKSGFVPHWKVFEVAFLALREMRITFGFHPSPVSVIPKKFRRCM